MLEAYQKIPHLIDPVALSIGSISVRWYSLMYLIGFFVFSILILYRIKNKESEIINAEDFWDLLLYLAGGLLLGGRLVYVLFYDYAYFLNNPKYIFWPFGENGVFTGIFGMSYFGGLAGAILSGYIFCKIKKINFWKLADFIVPAIPAGYFFGRMGNFLNGELYGKISDVFWAMNFPLDYSNSLRHPSQLYEAFFEGVVLFIFLWTIRNKAKFSGQLLIFYSIGYALVRFFIEFFREQDINSILIAGILSKGQLLSIVILIVACVFYILRRCYNKAS